MKTAAHFRFFILICLGLLSMVSQSQICNRAQLPSNLQNGLVAFYPFCGNANDVSGNGLNAVANSGTFVADRFGQASAALSLNGTGQRMDLPINNSYNRDTFSIVFWTKPNSDMDPHNQIQLGNLGSSLRWSVSWAPGFMRFYPMTCAGGYAASGSMVGTGLPLASWSHVAVIVEGTTVKFYKNGVFLGQQTGASPLTCFNTGMNLFIGCDAGGGSLEYYNGLFDDLLFYSRALSACEVYQLYSATSTIIPESTASYNRFSDTTRFCGSSTTLDAGIGFSAYSWNTGATTQTIAPTTSGFLKVTVTSALGCTASDSTYLSLVNANILNNDTTICKGAAIKLSIDSLFPGRTACTNAELPTNLRTGLVGYWPFCGNATDQSGKGYNGTVNGAVLTSDRYGNTNSAFSFNGNSSYITLPSINEINGTVGFTVTAWAKINGWNTNTACNSGCAQFIISRDNDPTTSHFKLAFDQAAGAERFGGSVANFSNPSAQVSSVSTYPMPHLTWHHVAMTVRSGVLSFYVDGVLKSSKPWTQPIGASSAPIYIGKHSLSTFPYFVNGSIDDVFLYNRGLDSTEIRQLSGSGISTSWSTGATTNSITVSPTQTTTYYVTVSDGIGTCTDSVKVSISAVDTAVTALDPTAICSTGAIQVRLQANASIGYTYQWFFNGTAIPSSNVRTYTATQTGNYRVLLTNALGCRDSSRTLTINVVQTPSVNTITNQTFCHGGLTSTIPITGAVAGAVYSWTNNTPSIGLAASGTGDIPAFTAVNSGASSLVSTITITPTNTISGITCTGAPISFTITVNPPPSVNAISNQTICNGANTSPISFGGAVAGSVFSWTNNTTSIGLATSGTGNIASFNALNGTSSPVTATITVTPSYTNAGLTCTGTPRTFTITVNPTPTASIANPGTSVICQGSSATLTASGGSTYQWNLNGNLIPGATSATYAATLAGVYTVVPISAFGCTGAVSNAITLTLIMRPTADFIFDKYCAGFPTNFTNLSQVNGTGVVGSGWSFGDGGNSTLVSPSHVFAQTGTYNVALVMTPLACPTLSSTITKPIAIQPPPANIRYPSMNAIVNRDQQLQARLFTGAGYQWLPSTGLSNPAVQTPVFNYNQQQEYRIRISTPDGCVITDTVLVRMFPQREIYVPTTFTPNGDGVNDRLIPRLVGITDLIYFRVYDRWGQPLYETSSENEGWDGAYKGVKQPMETYAWIAAGKDIDGNIIKRSGTTILLR